MSRLIIFRETRQSIPNDTQNSTVNIPMGALRDIFLKGYVNVIVIII